MKYMEQGYAKSGIITASHVAVVIPVFNAEQWVARAIESVLEQGYSNLTVIAVDDGSTDHSADVIRDFLNRVELLKGPNCGACHARNRGFRFACEQGAKYVFFLDSDDYHEGEVIAGSVAAAEQNNADVVISNLYVEQPEGHRTLRHNHNQGVTPEQVFKRWWGGELVNPSCVMWSTTFLQDIGIWDETLTAGQDLELHLRAMIAQPKLVKNDNGMALYTKDNAASISRTRNPNTINSHYTARKILIELARDTKFEKFTPLMYPSLYFLARSAFELKQLALGRRIVMFLQKEGYRDHPGTFLHSWVASTIGLENKVFLWKRKT